MLSPEEKRRLDSYFGFARKARSLSAGMDLEEKLSEDRIALLIILKNCSEKTGQKLQRRCSEKTAFILYSGTYDVTLACRFETLKAVGITDPHLATVIQTLLASDMTCSKGGLL
jgi:hypothetical protein